MITEDVIKEIYKKYRKPPKDSGDLEVEKYVGKLKEHHNISTDGFKIVVGDLDEFNPFRQFLIRSLHAVLEFDKVIAFVFARHILFFGKNDMSMRVHLKPEDKKSIFDRIFGGEA